MKNQKGITLIALIITIIVMIILVGVTINVAIQGGLFGQASGAASDTQKELEREMLMSAVLGSLDQNGYVDFNKLDMNLPSGFTKVGDRTYRSAKGNTFIVSSNGTISILEGEQEGGLVLSYSNIRKSNGPFANVSIYSGIDKEAVAKQLLISEGLISESETVDDGLKRLPAAYGGSVYTDLNAALEFINTHLLGLSSTQGRDDTISSLLMFAAEIKVNNVPYNMKNNGYLIQLPGEETEIEVKIGGLTKTITIHSDTRLGKRVNYLGYDWYVLYDDDTHGVELLSAEAFGSVTLGSDSRDGGSMEQAVYSYNNLTSILTQACIDETGITTNIRNIGGPAQDPANLEYFSASEIPGYDVNNDNWYTLNIVEPTRTHDDDLRQMSILGLYSTDTPTEYWISSRTVGYTIMRSGNQDDKAYIVSFSGIWSFEDPGEINDYGGFWTVHNSIIICVDEENTREGYDDRTHSLTQGPYAVRPVIKISSELLDELLAAQSNS